MWDFEVQKNRHHYFLILANWRFWTMVLEKTLENPLDCKEIQPVHPKRDQPWVFTGRTDAETETQILWPPHAKSWFFEKDPDAGRDWGQEENGMTEGEMARWHYWHDGHEFEQTPGVCDEQAGLVCCDSWGCKESDTTERLNWTELNCTWLILSANKRLIQKEGIYVYMGFPGGASGKEPPCQCRRLKRYRFNPWVRKIP